jgi:hypothetical protein
MISFHFDFNMLFTLRIVGWLTMDGVLYQGNSIASKRKKREEENGNKSEDEASGMSQESILQVVLNL